MKATVFYPIETKTITVRNFYDLDGTIEVHNTETGERFPTESFREYYQEVGEYEDVNSDDHWQFLEDVYGVFNSLKPSEISEKIRNGELTVSHSSMSIGDVVVIEGIGSFITAGIGFDEIEF